MPRASARSLVTGKIKRIGCQWDDWYQERGSNGSKEFRCFACTRRILKQELHDPHGHVLRGLSALKGTVISAENGSMSLRDCDA